MKLCKVLMLALGLCGLAMPVVAAPACYEPQQIRAEQLLRLHSELMVITVTCRQGSNGQDLVSAYSGFTKRNIGALREAEQTMIAYYKTRGGGDAVAKLDRLRTLLGNEYGQKAADMSAPVFCGAYRDRVLSFYGASARDIDGEVMRMTAAERSYAKSCDAEKKPRVAAKR